MVFIVSSHYSMKTIWHASSYYTVFKTMFFQPFGQIGVDLFVMISGYFLIIGNHSVNEMLEKDIKLWIKVFHYSVFTLILGLILFPTYITIGDVLRGIFPIVLNGYWFVTSFLILMLLVPMINNFINHSNKRLNYFIFSILLFSSGLQSILPLSFTPFGKGLNLGILICGYCFGAFVHKYDVKPDIFLLTIFTFLGLSIEFVGMVYLKKTILTNGPLPF